MGRETGTLRPRRRGTWLLALSSHTMCYRWSQGLRGFTQNLQFHGRLAPTSHLFRRWGPWALQFIHSAACSVPRENCPVAPLPISQAGPRQEFCPFHLKHTPPLHLGGQEEPWTRARSPTCCGGTWGRALFHSRGPCMHSLQCPSFVGLTFWLLLLI